MKNIILLLILLFSTSLKAQNFPKNPNKKDKNGIGQGKWTILYDPNFKIVSTKDSAAIYAVGKLIDGNLDEDWVYYDAKTSVKRFEMIFQNGVKNGIASSYYENGKLNSQGLYANGMRNGFWYYYHQNGQTKLELMLQNNVKIGVSKEYNEAGKLIKQVEY